jgi:hypothetical protein
VLFLMPLLCGREAEVLEDVLAATCRIADKETSATCFLVAAGGVRGATAAAAFLVTAAHFLEGTTAAECPLVLRAQNPDGTYARRETPVVVRDGDGPRWKRHADADLAVLAIELPNGLAVKPFRVDQLADAESVAEGRVRVGQEVVIPCFPAKTEANEAGWPILRRGMIATHPLAPVTQVKTYFIDVSTFGGDSGAPVVAAGREALVVGVVVGMQRQTDRSTLPFEEKTVHMPLGLAIVAQAAFVRELVEAMGRQ